MENWKTELKKWADREDLDGILKAELKELMQDEEANKALLQEYFYKDLEFGTGGLRGVLGVGSNRMNIYTVGKATQGLADYIKEELHDGKEDKIHSVAIGYDSRINSKLFAERAAAVFAANDIKVFMYDELYPVPSLAFAVRHHGCDMGVMITASHNPSKYNGYKVYNSRGCQVTEEAAEKILQAVGKVDAFDGVKAPDFEETKASPLFEYLGEKTKEAYLQTVMAEAIYWTEDKVEIAKAMADLNVVYTPLNGSGNKPVREIINRLGMKNVAVVPEQEAPDGNFPTCPYPNPEKKETLELGLALCKERGAELLLATDPDCDRIGIASLTADGEYRLFDGNQVGLMLFDYIVNMRKTSAAMPMPPRPVVVRTIVSTNLIDRMAAANGVDVQVTLTGFKYIGEYMGKIEDEGREKDYIFGFEESYGYLSGTYVRDKDGVNAAMLICIMAAYHKACGRTLTDALDNIYKTYGYAVNDLMDFAFEGLSGMEKMQGIMEGLRNCPPKEVAGKKVIKAIDYKNDDTGLPSSNVLEYTLEGGSGFTARPSGTEPKLKIYVRAGGKTANEAAATAAGLKAELRTLAEKNS